MKNPTVFIIDDDPSQIELLKIGLSCYEFEVQSNQDPQQALENIKQTPPDIILLDYNMPVMDGPSFCHQLRKVKSSQYIPIIMITARTDIESKVIGLESGADEYVTKPYLIEEVVARIHSMLRLKNLHDQLHTANQRLSELASLDELTKIKNYRSIIEKLDEELIRSQRYKTPLSIFLFDIDFFKKVNDTYGHQGGDEVLKYIGENLSLLTRKTDDCGRYGGEEFLIVFPLTPINQAQNIAERIRLFFEESKVKYMNQFISFTISGGIAEFKDLITKEKLIQIADKGLYHAKEHGRNQIIINES